jgi:hypothetical protein
MKIFAFCFLIVFLFSCASQSPLTGGDIDKTPPKLVKSIPPNYSVNVKPNNIYLEFDEFIQLHNPLQKLIISPPLKNNIEIKQKPKGFTLIFKDTLQNETTYQIYFSDAIVDLNEGNALNDFTYVFSTGKEIDTLKIAGEIIDSYTLKPEPNFTVCLYSDTTDSVIFKTNPVYITKTNNEGKFELKHLHKNIYKLVAYYDKNNNYRFEPVNEKIAFLSNNINLNSNIDTIKLFSFQENRIKPYIKKIERIKPYNANIIFSNTLKEKPFIIESSAKILSTWYSPNYDTLKLFFADSLQYRSDTIKIKIKYALIDTLFNKYYKSEEKNIVIDKKNLSNNKTKLNFLTSVKKNQSINSKIPILITFTEPTELKEENIKLLYFQNDSVIQSIKFSLTNTDSCQLQYKLAFDWQDGKKYRLILSQITSYYGNLYNNDTIDFFTSPIEDFATLSFNYKIKDDNNKNYFFEIINDKNITVYSWTDIKSNKKIIDRLYPGKYTIRCFIDENKNNVWDTGFYILHKQPEKVYIYPQTFQLRANWDLEIVWKLE